MRNKPIQADQLIPTSATPPPEAGFYRIDRQTIGVVGNMSFRDPNTQAMMPVGKGAIPFPGFAPRLLASLVASSTAACTSGVVTVTATSHGLPATIFDGHEIYYPGSPTLAAGWYGGFVRTDANTVAFSAPSSADFGSESVNAGAAVTTEVTAYSMTLPVGSLPAGNIVSARMQRSADAVASAHTIIMKIGSDTIGRYVSSAASPTGTFSLSAAIVSATQICGASALEGVVSSSVYNVTFDPSVENTLSITLTLGAAGMYQRIGACKVSIS